MAGCINERVGDNSREKCKFCIVNKEHGLITEEYGVITEEYIFITMGYPDINLEQL